MKKIWFLSLLVLFWFSFAQVALQPNYSSDRFQPSDKFHAGCENSIDVIFSLNYSNIFGLNAILWYNSNDVEILKIDVDGEKENNLSYVVEEDKIIFNKLKTSDDWLKKIVFKIDFKVEDILQSTDFRFHTWSYVLDDKWNMVEISDWYKFDFQKVPECDPDIVSPSVELLFPLLETGQYAPLDSYFQFKISDLWKWINKDSLEIFVDDIRYDLSNVENEWSGNVLTIYPDEWLPLASDFKILVNVSDKQVYWKANYTSKEFVLATSSGLNLLNEIDPVQFRKLVNKNKYYQWSKMECDWLSQNYVSADEGLQDVITSINKRLNCGEMTGFENFLNVEDEDLDQNNSWFSVFSVLWWLISVLLFFVVIFRWLWAKHKK